jgi:rhomboid protease GluP
VRAVLALIAVNIVVEMALQGADLGLWGSGLWRPMAYQNGGFWVGLLHDWQPNFAGQRWTMFLTYSVLHSGFGHLAGNMVSLWFLGNLVVARFGEGRMLAVYGFASVAGAAAFGVMSAEVAPMVGASGAVFGLAGALRPGWRALLGLVALNGVLWVVSGGNLAWQAHLGGFLLGAILATFRR